MIAGLRKPTRMTAAEYLAFEEVSETRHEYQGGIAYPIDETPIDRSEEHAIIQLNVAGALSAALPDSMIVLTSIGRLEAPYKQPCGEVVRNFVYSDILVCEVASARAHGICQRPRLIIDVLTPTTERGDRYWNSIAYKQRTSLDQYLFITDHTPCIEVYRRRNDWRREMLGIDDTVTLESIDLTITGRQIYRRIKF